MGLQNQTVILYGDPSFQEATAEGVITPGFLCLHTSGGGVIANNVAQDPNPLPMFAHEDDLRGGCLTDDYAIGAVTKTVTAQNGDRINAVAGAVVAVGETVESAGNGKLIPVTTGKGIGIAREAAAADGDWFEIEII